MVTRADKPISTNLTRSKPKITVPGMVTHACNPSYSTDRDRRIMSSRSAQAKLVRPYLKNKGAMCVAQVVQLPRKHKVLGQILRTVKNKTKLSNFSYSQSSNKRIKLT
jgi:hypothetical protein